jgi:hypothetical protein
LPEVRRNLEPVAPADPAQTLVSAMTDRAMTSATMGFSWIVVVVSCASLAVTTSSAAAWLAFALAVGLPALTFMVMAHSPAKSIAQIIREADAGV